ncbi:4-alpha-glucanotransferase [Chelatococcus sp. GCM10030263]|uniref:4-alpha-glucanotransferase n=1 Tax=Chelatococcus sp. GCM10030263 TaxID=3273387 RepID=UPI0036187281
MTDDARLQQLARKAGIAVEWIDARDEPQVVDMGTIRYLLDALGFPCRSDHDIAESLRMLEEEASTRGASFIVTRVGQATPIEIGSAPKPFRITLEDGRVMEGRGGTEQTLLPPITLPGYHSVEIGDRVVTLAVTPRRCFTLADAVGERRAWGLAAQLYGLRRERTGTLGDGGIGDFTALARLAEIAAAAGGDALSIGPVHALFTADPSRISPYSPSSRLFLNPLHADPAALAGPALVQEAVERSGLADVFAHLEREDLVDWPAAAQAKLALFRELKTLFGPQLVPGSGALADDFLAFQSRGGQALFDHATFEALHAARLAADPSAFHWRQWPAEYQDPRSDAVKAFALEQTDEIAFHIFLQWLADASLAKAHAAAREAGMGVGLINDLAIGTDSGGSYAWAQRGDIMNGVSVGAPPDLFNQLGQNWGLTALSPRTLRARGFQPFTDTLRAGMRHAGGLRIDHVLGLARLWLVPDGASPAEGAYLAFPRDEMLQLAALESWRHRAILIGEDLGTVPPGLRETLEEIGILGMRVLWFEREDEGGFADAEEWPRAVAAMTTTHDLPTVAGWWTGRDIEWRSSLHLFGSGTTPEGERETRAEDRLDLWTAFRRAGVASGAPPAEDGPTEAVVTAAVDFVARTPADLALVPVEDILGLAEQPNLPGTTDEHPNWRQRLPGETAALFAEPAPQERLQRLRKARPQP